jgi:hypothetical protein
VIVVPVKSALSKYVAERPFAPPPVAARNVAVYVVEAAGVDTSWRAAPPSDHETNSYDVPLAVCGATASMFRTIPTTLSNDRGVTTGWPSSFS